MRVSGSAPVDEISFQISFYAGLVRPFVVPFTALGKPFEHGGHPPDRAPDWACLALPPRIITVTMYGFAQAFAVLGILLWFLSRLWEQWNRKDRTLTEFRASKRPVQRARQDGSPMHCDESISSRRVLTFDPNPRRAKRL
jgi:hypothetical protein